MLTVETAALPLPATLSTTALTWTDPYPTQSTREDRPTTKPPEALHGLHSDDKTASVWE